MDEEVVPVLYAKDAARAVAWYGRLGFIKEWEHQFEPGFSCSFRSHVGMSGSTCRSTRATPGRTPRSTSMSRTSTPCPGNSGFPSMRTASPGGNVTSLTRTATGCAWPPGAVDPYARRAATRVEAPAALPLPRRSRSPPGGRRELLPGLAALGAALGTTFVVEVRHQVGFTPISALTGLGCPGFMGALRSVFGRRRSPEHPSKPAWHPYFAAPRLLLSIRHLKAPIGPPEPTFEQPRIASGPLCQRHDRQLAPCAGPTRLRVVRLPRRSDSARAARPASRHTYGSHPAEQPALKAETRGTAVTARRQRDGAGTRASGATRLRGAYRSGRRGGGSDSGDTPGTRAAAQGETAE